MFSALLLTVLLFPATSPQDQRPLPQPQSSSRQPAPDESGPLTFRVTTREVLLDLIALDNHDHPILNLNPADLQVSVSAVDATAAVAKPKHKLRHRPAPPTPPPPPAEIEPVSSLHLIDPNAPQSSGDDTQSGFRITASCLERTTLHYQLAFHPGPNGANPGYHQIVIATHRPGVKLIYRHRYYIGQSTPLPNPITKTAAIEKLLRDDACYYPDTPLSISLRAHLIDTGSTGILRYNLAVDAGSLSFLTLTDATARRQPLSLDRQVQLDYGACTFDAAGHPLNFFHAPLDQVLTSVDYARALAHGFPHVLEFPAPPNLALTRFIVRDRATGNLGATDVQFSVPNLSPASTPNSASNSAPNSAPESAPSIATNPHALAAQTATDLSLYAAFSHGVYIPPPHGPIGSFGSIVPAPDSFCGDVFELAQPSARLPDFRELDPIGSLYTSTLDVPSQVFSNTSGIPGVTPRTNLFGIDYHAVFWIRNAGDYAFRMISDDGALLSIDDTQLIDLDGLHSALADSRPIHLDPGPHTLHIPYYQGAVTSVALELWIQPPNAGWQIFDLRNFPPPTTPPSPESTPTR